MSAPQVRHPRVRSGSALRARLETMLKDRSDLRHGSMFGCPAWYVRGRLCFCVYGDVIGVRVPSSLAAALRSGPGRIASFRPFGRPAMREWIALRPATRAELLEVRWILERSIEFVSSGPRTAAGARTRGTG